MDQKVRNFEGIREMDKVGVSGKPKDDKEDSEEEEVEVEENSNTYCIKISQIQPQISKEAIWRHFNVLGPVLSVTLKDAAGPSGFLDVLNSGVVRFECKYSQELALSIPWTLLCGRMIKIGPMVREVIPEVPMASTSTSGPPQPKKPRIMETFEEPLNLCVNDGRFQNPTALWNKSKNEQEPTTLLIDEQPPYFRPVNLPNEEYKGFVVFGLSPHTLPATLEKTFSEFGPIAFVIIESGLGFVEMEKFEDADTICNQKYHAVDLIIVECKQIFIPMLHFAQCVGQLELAFAYSPPTAGNRGIWDSAWWEPVFMAAVMHAYYKTPDAPNAPSPPTNPSLVSIMMLLDGNHFVNSSINAGPTAQV